MRFSLSFSLGPVRLELLWKSKESARFLGALVASSDAVRMKMKDLPLCPDCASASVGENTVRDTFNDVLHLTTVEAVLAIKVDTTEHRHLIDENDLVALYTVPRSTPLTCSNPHSATHLDGLITRARCGGTYRMGYDCAAQLIENWNQIDRVATKAREWKNFVPSSAARLRRLRARADEAMRKDRALQAFRSLVRDQLPWFDRELNDHLRTFAVAVPGRALFDWSQGDIGKRLGALSDLEWQRSKWEADIPGRREQKDIELTMKTLEERLDAFDEWIRASETMLTRAGFERAAAALDTEMRDARVEEFDPYLGRTVSRLRPRPERVRVRCSAVEDGIRDVVSDRLIPVMWMR